MADRSAAREVAADERDSKTATSVRKTHPADVNRQARHDRIRDAVVKQK